ncbi:MAG TPA: beta-propeller fold lactonase family protein [Stellaceae bacterium]|jgi:6-phosphogluconolactonase|nr:beta-propeller fold lactonase family protein [Stellaceae bacterium]
MPSVLYVGLQDADKIAVFSIDDAGKLSKQGEVDAEGGPSVMAVSADRRMLYVGGRGGPAITTFRIDPNTGALTTAGTAAQPHAPTFLAPDRTGRFMLVAYYQGGGTAVYRIAGDGTVGAASQEWLPTATGAHAIATDRSNRFAYVPHIARVQDNVLEPPKNIPGPNTIMQFRFDAESGTLAPNAPPRVAQADLVGPRHFCFHPSLDLVYFSNEQGCSVSSYRVNPGNGTLAPLQTISTRPAGFDARNTCSQIHLTPSGRFLYVGNRGHNSIAGFRVAPDTGHLVPAGHAGTEAVPSAFCLDPEGRFLFAGGTATGRLASYRIDGDSEALTPLAVADVGPRPAAMASVRL